MIKLEIQITPKFTGFLKKFPKENIICFVAG